MKSNEFLLKTWKKLKESDIGYRMAKGAFWSFTGTAFAKLIVLISGIICARTLTKNEYGEFGIIRSTINMFVVFGSVGLGLTVTKYIAEFKETNKQKVISVYFLTNFLVFITGFLITLIVVVLAPYIARASLNAPYLVSEIRIGALLLFITIINSVQNGTLVGFEDFRSIAFNTLIASLIEAFLMNIGALLYKVHGAIFGFGLGYITLLVMNFLSIQKNFLKYDIKQSFQCIDYKDIHIFHKFSIPAALSGIMVMPVFWFVKTMLVKRAGFGEVGIFEAADQWRIMILFIPGAVSQIVLPILSGIQKEKDKNLYWKVLKYNLLINGGISLLLAIGVVVFSPAIMGFYGPLFIDAMPLVVLSGSTIFISIANVVGISIASQSKMWIGFGFNLVWAVLLILFSTFFLQKGLGATGLAWAVLCSYFIHVIGQSFYLVFSKKR